MIVLDLLWELSKVQKVSSLYQKSNGSNNSTNVLRIQYINLDSFMEIHL